MSNNLEHGGRIPPQAVEVEYNVLGSMIWLSDALETAMGLLKEDYFYSPNNRLLYSAILELYIEGSAIDVITLENKLRSKEIWNSLPSDYFETLSFAQSSNIEYHIAILKEKAILRKLILSSTDIIKRAYDTSEDVFDILDSAHADLFKLDEDELNSTHDIGDVIHEVIHMIDKAQSGEIEIGLNSGLDIDKILEGFKNGLLYVVAGRPSMGKTAFVLTILRQLATAGHPAGIISLETVKENIVIRLLTAVSKIEANKITSGKLTQYEHAEVLKAASVLESLGVVIDDDFSVNIRKLISKCRYMVKVKKCKIIFIDYLQLMDGEDKNKVEAIGKLSRTCKKLSKELNIPVVLLSQLSREVEKRTDKRPMLSDLRGSGDIEQDADVVMFLYRAEYYDIPVDEHGNSTAGVCEVIIDKHRDGKVGTMRQLFDKEAMTFRNIDIYHKAEEGQF